MPRYRKHAERRSQLLLAPGVQIPVVLHYEARPGGRVAVGRRELIMRIPIHCAEAEQHRVVEHFTDWARRLYARSPEKLAHLIDRPVGTGGTIRVMDREFRVEIQPGDHPTQSRMERDPAAPNRLRVYRARAAAAAEGGSREIETLLGRMLAKIFLPEITARVHALNDRHFQQAIRAVRLKLMDSRWGSCTRTGNVTLSSRMLLAPAPVRDAVIVHELAHLIELNHGPRFWALVYDAVPDYRTHDRWLKRHGAHLRFVLDPA
jgi:predicted metal-dependent hydrolase